MTPTDNTPESNAVLQKCRDKKLVFTITTGRSGTDYLQTLLDLPECTTCLHEGDPNFLLTMRVSQNDRRLAYNFLVQSKLPAIADYPGHVYVETSHLFCKGFFEPLIRLGLIPDLIILRRSNREVAKSLTRLGTVPGRTIRALQYYLTPYDPGVLPLPHWQLLNNYQLCFWYCLEIERRMKYYTEVARNLGAVVVETSATRLRSIDTYKTLLQDLDIPFNDKLITAGHRKISDTIVNQKADKKQSIIFNDADLDTYEQEVLERVWDFCPDIVPNNDE